MISEEIWRKKKKSSFQVYTFYLNPNNVTNEVTVMHKCSFLPPTGRIEEKNISEKKIDLQKSSSGSTWSHA